MGRQRYNSIKHLFGSSTKDIFWLLFIRVQSTTGKLLPIYYPYHIVIDTVRLGSLCFDTLMIAEAPQFFFRPSKRAQDNLEFWIPRGGLRILCQWNLHFRVQSLVGLGFFDPYYGSKAEDSGFVQIIAWFVVIFSINTTSDISKLLYVISRAVRRVKFETILRCHEWYVCQLSSTN